MVLDFVFRTAAPTAGLFLTASLALASQGPSPLESSRGQRVAPTSLGSILRIEPRLLPASDVDPARAHHAYSARIAASPTAPQDAPGSVSTLLGPPSNLPWTSDHIVGPALFDGGNTAIPPDTGIAAGPDHLMTVLNRNVSVWDKPTGARLLDVTLSSFFGAPPAPALGNPRVVWDPHARRFVATASNFDTRIYLAISASADPTAGWYTTWLTVPPGVDYPDYPLLAVDAEGIYVSARMVGIGHGDGAIFAIDKDPLLAPQPSLGAVTFFGPFADEIAVQPCQTFGSAPGQHFISNVWNTNVLKVRRIEGPLTAPTLVLQGSLMASLPEAPIHVPASGSTQPLHLGNTELGDAIWHRGRIWTVMTCGVSGRAAVRWFEVDPAGPTIIATGTVSSPVRHYYHPGIAVNARGDVMLAFNGSSPSEFASVWISAHLGTDAAGAFAPPSMIKAGEGAYNVLDGLGLNRWGNHNTVVFDAGDPHIFWSFSPYARQGNRWGTWIAKHELGAPGESICAGDGIDLAVDVPCPCGNFGARRHGCANSVVAEGALLESTGRIALDDVTLFASGMPAGTPAIFFAGDAMVTGGAPFGDGIRCAGGVIVRMKLVTAAGGAAEFPQSGDASLSTASGFTLGSAAYAWYQVAYRNTAVAFCPPGTLNVTNAQRILW